MNADVDLSRLAIDRRGKRVGSRRHALTRYVLPGAILLGVLGVIAWSTREMLFPPRPVTVIPVSTSHDRRRQEGTPLFEAAGWIEPRPTAIRVAAMAPGVVERLLVVEGQAVEAGEAIVELVQQDASLACQRAEADLALAEAEHHAAEAVLEAATTRFEQPVHLEAVLSQADAELAKLESLSALLPFETRRAEAQLAQAKQSIEGKVSAGGAIAGRTVEEARRKHESAQSLLDELLGRVDSLRAEREALQRRRDALAKQLELRIDEKEAKEEASANVRVAEARERRMRIALEEARLRLDRMTVVSPVDGRVLHLLAQPGSRLAVGGGNSQARDAGTVVTLYRPDMLQARVDVRFEDLPRVRVGQAVLVKSPALATGLSGKVLLVSSEADIQKNTLEVKVAVADPSAVLKPEMLVDVTFLAPAEVESGVIESDEPRLLVPERLIESDDTGHYLWIADQSAGVARRTSVEIEETAVDGLVEIRGGLNPASRIIVGGRDGLREGERIRVTGEDAGTRP